MRRAGQMRMRREDGRGADEDYPGEKLVAELMGSSLLFASVRTPDGVVQTIMEAAVPQGSALGFNTDDWLAALKERGWSVTVDENSVTFAVIRG